MRLMVYLKSSNKQSYLEEQQAYTQGLIYSLLGESDKENIHDSGGKYKFTSFSNIFSRERGRLSGGDYLKEGEDCCLIISSAYKDVIRELEERLQNRNSIKIGYMEFNVSGASSFDMTISEEKMTSATPVVLRMSEEQCEKYNIENDYSGSDDNKGSYYWRPGDGLNAFMDGLEENLRNKYCEFYGREPSENRSFIKDISITGVEEVVLRYEGAEINHIGAMCVIGYDWPGDRENSRMVKMAYDSGIGELNTSGCGFVNEGGIND